MRLTVAVAAFGMAAGPAAAQSYTVTVTQANVGTVTSALTGETLFRISPSVSGGVAKAPGGGNGSMLQPGSGRSTVSIKCTGGQCNSSTIKLIVTASGTTTGRAKAPQTFTVADGSADASGTGPWTISGISNGQTRTVYLGMDLPIEANTSSKNTGNASAGFTVRAEKTGASSIFATANGTVAAYVLRAINIANTGALTFGKVVRGAGSVTINQDTGARSTDGAVVAITSTTGSRATFKVTGETNRQINVNVPGSVAMAGPGQMTIALFKNTGNTVNLSQIVGQPTGSGEYTLGVGGQVVLSATTATGIYSGSFIVQVDYQ